MKTEIKPIGFVYTDAETIPRHWSLSDVEGTLEIKKEYIPGLKDIKPGQKIVVLFLFHKSSKFTTALLFQTPPHNRERKGVFSICSPFRPNPIGMSVVKVLEINGGMIRIKGIDMLNETPIIDIKPYIESKYDCPSYDDKP